MDELMERIANSLAESKRLRLKVGKFGVKVIRQVLEAHGWSVREMASVVGCSQSHLSRIMSGEKGMSLSLFLEIGSYLPKKD